jgi:hypothetical protein
MTSKTVLLQEAAGWIRHTLQCVTYGSQNGLTLHLTMFKIKLLLVPGLLGPFSGEVCYNMINKNVKL